MRKKRWAQSGALSRCRPRPRSYRLVLALSVALCAATLGDPAIGHSDPEPVSAATDRQEQTLWTRDGIVVSHVSYLLPLPASAAPHPAACDRVGYLRYRPADGPADSARADHIVVQEQGLGGGAVNSDSVAANTVRSARSMGQHVEFWALSRRSACLDETFGFDYALRSGDYLDAVDYYFNGKVLDGQRFDGFKSNDQLAVLDAMGMERVLWDQLEVMRYEVPERAVRQQKYVCTGISLGGLVTGFFADWDFGAAGFGADQCAAFAAQDSMASSDPVALQSIPVLREIADAVVTPLDGVFQTGFRAGVLPRTFGPVPVLGTRTFFLLRLAGLAAHLDPDGESRLLAHLPHDLELDATLNFLAAPTWSGFATNGADGSGSIRDFRFTNTALLGMLIDNNSVNFTLFQQGVGALDGGPVMAKSFPTPGEVAQIPLFGSFLRMSAGTQQRVFPTDRNALYTWRNYDNVRGIPFTAPNHEVADIRDAARQLATGAPYAYWETYFPLRLVIDIAAGYGGSRTGELAALRGRSLARTKPYFVAFAGDSMVQTGIGTFFPAPATAQVVTLPGYNHIDTIGAAAVQNDGQPDYSGHQLALFVRSLG
ncbi:hypothetical protein [Nocardia huaxiensis]|uniref:hypothetical protein n=1 Tax=Nocardia huaxiensis TaxID=2755382 RepID=UPI001E604CFC|nr:hypothetical protein [Nocardia huaxiensis]UFS98253.1 hypothetical protein LPY97_10320 [Nocardia huaxiensis]